MLFRSVPRLFATSSHLFYSASKGLSGNLRPKTCGLLLPSCLHPPSRVPSNSAQRLPYTSTTMMSASPETSKNAPSGRVFFFDIDNCLYHKSSGIYVEMGKRIHEYFKRMGFPDEEASELHVRYYTEYGLAVRGLVKYHDIDPLAYDVEVDQSIPLDLYLKNDPELRKMLDSMKDVKKWAFTNAYSVHAKRVLKFLGIDDQFAGLTFCDYAKPNFSCKPEEAYYHEVMKAAGVTDPSKCYLVDDAAVNVDTAKRLGWTAVHVTDTPEAEPKHGHFQIADVKDLPKILPEFWVPQ
ncbi:Haloacid dehalogenase-like hydrolase-domain-containing protein [Phlyctochytrium arcticum]|nr:Haloacid dehalogenase-like hydrolase-domain-containing protein [Phlyctochytrium arcticum]